jgi:hypothetical protein
VIAILRVSRILMPGAGATLAIGAVVFLVLGDVASVSGPEGRVASPPSGAHRPARSVECSRVAVRPPETASAPTTAKGLPGPPVAARTSPVVDGASEGGSAQPTYGRFAGARSPSVPRLDPSFHAASPDAWRRELARGGTLLDKLAIVDELSARCSNDELAPVLVALLGGEIPGPPQEAQSLRLALLSRLGRLTGAVPDEAIAQRIGSGFPRPERLLALELVAGRPGLARADVEAIARDEGDVAVRDKARWVLARNR